MNVPEKFLEEITLIGFKRVSDGKIQQSMSGHGSRLVLDEWPDEIVVFEKTLHLDEVKPGKDWAEGQWQYATYN